MSIFKDANQWADKYKACGAPHQSPINLSRSFALPCDRLCELTIDKVDISKAHTGLLTPGITLLAFSAEKPSLRFNGEGYTVEFGYFFNPAQHTIENIKAEAEFVLVGTNPKGYALCVSVPVRTAAGDTPSTNFFNKFVPFSVGSRRQQVVLGDQWSLQDIIPENKGYYVYEGSWLLPGCDPDVTWVVFASSVTIDPSDYAKVASKGGGSRPLQEVADRQVFFNDGEKIEGGGKKDGKVYMKCRRVPREGEISSSDAKAAIRQGNVVRKNQEITDKNRSQALSNMQTQIGDTYASIGGLWGILSILTFAGIAYFLFSEKGATLSRSFFSLLMVIPAYINRYTFALIFGQ